MKRALRSGNGGTWGVPGGNQDPEDGGDLSRTAFREAAEEMQPVPEVAVRGHFLTRRGKRGQKHFTLFVCTVTEAQRGEWAPRLDTHEHTEWRWFPAGDVAAAAAAPDSWVHPVVRLAFTENRADLDGLLAGGGV